MQRLVKELTYFSLVILLLAASNSAELSPRASRLAENLGILLGLPLDLPMPASNVSAVPDFIMDVYNCWTAMRGSSNRGSCLPMSSDQSSKELNDVNVVRGIKSTGIRIATDGVYSHSPVPSPLPPSLAINFNVSLRRVKEDVRFVYVRVEKPAMTTEQKDYIEKQCNGDISVTLLVNINDTGAYTMLSTAQLQLNEIANEQQIEFGDITSQFKQWLKENSQSAAPHEIVQMRLIVNSGHNCLSSPTPEDLGFTNKSDAFIVVFSKSDDTEEAIIKAGLAELAAEATASRQRRDLETGSSSNGSNSTDDEIAMESGDADNSTDLSSLYPFNITLYHLRSCRRYSHTISFAELGWSDRIFQPLEYEANFCAGSCDYPLNGDYNTTKHSYIQSLAAKLNPELVPPPCCAPHELRPVTVIYMQGHEQFVTHEWHGMRAESCGCK